MTHCYDIILTTWAQMTHCYDVVLTTLAQMTHCYDVILTTLAQILPSVIGNLTLSSVSSSNTKPESNSLHARLK